MMRVSVDLMLSIILQGVRYVGVMWGQQSDAARLMDGYDMLFADDMCVYPTILLTFRSHSKWNTCHVLMPADTLA